jgi:hypothetical protein
MCAKSDYGKRAFVGGSKKYGEAYERIFPDDVKIQCACDGRICEGICREKNLHRKRKDFNTCPAAYPREN